MSVCSLKQEKIVSQDGPPVKKWLRQEFRCGFDFVRGAIHSEPFSAMPSCINQFSIGEKASCLVQTAM